MFEQSLLMEPAGAKKTGALAASLTLQTLAVGVLIALPLIFSDRLPMVPQFITLSLPAPPPPVHRQTVATSSTSRQSLVPARIFQAPRHIVALSEIPEISASDAPAVYSNAPDNGVIGGTGVPTMIAQSLLPTIPQAKPKPVEIAPAPPSGPIRVSSGVQEAKLLKRVLPTYPPLARQARVSGTVRLIGVIAKDGTMQQLRLVSGHPLLVDAALNAVRQWIYRPTLLSGQAVEVIAPIDVIFSLGQ
jgi:protein TonB